MEDPESQHDLVARAQAGDHEAFDQLVGVLRDRLLAFIRTRLSPALLVRTSEEDVLQETLLRSFRAVGRFRWKGEDSFLRWLTVIAEFVMRDGARVALRKRESSLEEEVVPVGRASPERSPSELLRQEERFDRLQGAYETLSPEHREVIRLCRLEGLPIEGVARRLGRTPGAVRQLLLRALKELRASFGAPTESLSLPPRALGTENATAPDVRAKPDREEGASDGKR